MLFGDFSAPLYAEGAHLKLKKLGQKVVNWISKVFLIMLKN